MHSTFRRLLGAIILIAAVGGASMLALRAHANELAQESAHAPNHGVTPAKSGVSEQHG